jgi:hypothetical protein
MTPHDYDEGDTTMAESARVVQLSERTRDPYRKQTKPRRSTDTGQKQKVATRVKDIPAAQLLCRIKHRWPMDEDLEPGKPLPRGVQVIPQSDGTKRIWEKCKRKGCPKHRGQETLPGGIYDPHAPYLYDSPQEWVVADVSLGMSPRTAKGAAMRGRVL